MGGKANITLSVIFHTFVIVALTVLAAREGMLGTTFKEIAVTIVPKEEKPKEEPKEEKPAEIAKAAEPTPQEEAKAEPVAEAPKAEAKPQAAPPPRVAPPVLVASAPPPAAIPPSFRFSGGTRAVQTSTDPIAVYRSYVEYTLHTSWSYPREALDSSLYSEVEVLVDGGGALAVKGWKHRAGRKDWDDSVQKVFDQIPSLRRQPPAGFPKAVVVRFDLVNRSLASVR